MRKADLLGLPIAEPHPLPANGKPVNYVSCFRLHELNGEKVLTMDAFDATCKTLMHRSFYWAKDYITHSLDTAKNAWKWRTGSIDYILDVHWWSDGRGQPLPDAESANAVRRFLPSADFEDDHLFSAVLKYQEKVRADKLHARHQRALEPTRKAMASVPDLPEGVEAWIDNDLLFKSRYLLYQYTGKKTQTAHCSRCGAYVESQGLRHARFATCPACGTEAQALAEGRISKYGFTDRISFCVIQRYDGTEIVTRHFNVSRYYEHDTVLHRLTYKDHWSESIRSIWHRDGKNVASEDYEKGVYKKNPNNGVSWIPYQDAPYPPHRICPIGLSEELRGTWAQYSGLDAFAKGRYLVKIDGYLKYWAQNPTIEYIVKGGLYRLAAEVSELIRSPYSGLHPLAAKTLRRHVGDLIRYNGGYHALTAFDALDKSNARYDPREVVRFMDISSDHNRIASLTKFSSLKKINDYLEKYKSRDVRELQDYWNMQKTLGANMTEKRVLFPENLSKAHDEAVKEYNKRKDEMMVKGFQIAAEQITKQFSFSAGEIMIVVPQSADDLTNEGKTLSHCVRSYAERVARGETVILFVRKVEEPEKPYFTMEVSNGQIIQLRGKNNCAPKEDVRKFEKEFCAHFHLLPRSA